MATGRHNSYLRNGEIGLLFIEPIEKPSALPLIDRATRLMTGALRESERHRVDMRDCYMGKHTCSCGVSDDARTRKTGKFRTNSLCVHYLAFHREEVPEDELADVLANFREEVEPAEHELVIPPKETRKVHVSERKECPRCSGNKRMCMRCGRQALYCSCETKDIRACRMCNGTGWNPRYKN